MMCIACEQDAMWFAYLQRKGLITPDGYLVEEPPFLGDAVEATPPQQGATKEKGAGVAEAAAADKNKFSCDDLG